MNANKKTAILVGVLYIIGTVTGILSVAATQPILSDPDYLRKISANENQMMIGILFWLTMGLALAMVPAMLYPILKKHNEALAIGYVIFRGALETVTYIVMITTQLLLILVSREYVAAGAPNALYFQTLGVIFSKGFESINPILIIVFSLDALMLYSIFYQSKLIPRWISGWGFLAIALHFTTAFLVMFHLVESSTSLTLLVMNFPILVQEMVMAVWLIAKGFNPSAIASTSAWAERRAI